MALPYSARLLPVNQMKPLREEAQNPWNNRSESDLLKGRNAVQRSLTGVFARNDRLAPTDPSRR